MLSKWVDLHPGKIFLSKIFEIASMMSSVLTVLQSTIFVCVFNELLWPEFVTILCYWIVVYWILILFSLFNNLLQNISLSSSVHRFCSCYMYTFLGDCYCDWNLFQFYLFFSFHRHKNYINRYIISVYQLHAFSICIWNTNPSLTRVDFFSLVFFSSF